MTIIFMYTVLVYTPLEKHHFLSRNIRVQFNQNFLFCGMAQIKTNKSVPLKYLILILLYI